MKQPRSSSTKSKHSTFYISTSNLIFKLTFISANIINECKIVDQIACQSEKELRCRNEKSLI